MQKMSTKKATHYAGAMNCFPVSWFVISTFTVLSLFFIFLNSSPSTFDVTVPFTESLSAQPAETSYVKSSQNPSDEILDSELPAVKSFAQSSDKPSVKILDSEQPAENSVAESFQKPPDKILDPEKPAEKSYAKSFQKPSDQILDFEKPTEKSFPKNSEKPSDKILGSETSGNTDVTANQKPEKPYDCTGKYIHILDLPSEFNTDYVDNCATINPWVSMCNYTENNGFGKKLEVSDNSTFSDSGWYITDQFTLEILFHYRMKQYRCLTDDSSKASAVYLPYYAGLDVGRYLWINNLTLRDETSLKFVEYVRRTPEWKKMGGRDHFLVIGRVSGDFRRYTDNSSEPNWGNHMLQFPEVMNMTSLLIEADPFSKSDIAIPYPTFFHPSSEYEVRHWQQKMRDKNRPHLFSFAGAARPNMKESIRNHLINQCLASNICHFMNCRRDITDCSEPQTVMRLFQSSDFCLQPPGDSYTRKSFFDTILAGCIPIVLHPASAYVQYLWHLPKDYTSYSVFLPMDEVKNGSLSIEKRLLEISKEKIKAMREEVIKLIPRIVYAKPSSNLNDFEDAFEVTVNGVLDRVATFKKELEEGKKSPSDSFRDELAWKYNFFGDLKNNEWDKYFDESFGMN